MKTDTGATVSLVWGLVAAIGIYAIMRVVQLLAGTAPDPAAVAWSIHSGFFWRALSASYAGGFVALVVHALARPCAAAWARALPPAMLTAASLLFLQALFFP